MVELSVADGGVGLLLTRAAEEVSGEHTDGHGAAAVHSPAAVQGRPQVERQHEEGEGMPSSYVLFDHISPRPRRGRRKQAMLANGALVKLRLA